MDVSHIFGAAGEYGFGRFLNRNSLQNNFHSQRARHPHSARAKLATKGET
jgi:hypothetical protein